MKTFFEETLKANTDYYEKAVLTGVLEIGSAHLLSGLNNVIYYDITHEDFSSFYGFTSEIFEEFMKDSPKKNEIEEMKKFYSGYIAKVRMGDKIEYVDKLNIFSVMNHLTSRGHMESYWANTGNFKSVIGIFKQK